MKNTNIKYGLSFSEVLLVIFIVLKILNLINWSWFWVLSPLWIPLVIFFILLIILLIIWLIIAFIKLITAFIKYCKDRFYKKL